ncbi:hypothetical protein Cpir12675_000649 [Ceratocystis pirilliformis]|uniref:Uncharacterized protein n=1 Tax=Ceratocystis pirilliformis TaxID=259994 RepID=A0ABR3ZL40_9PEZI
MATHTNSSDWKPSMHTMAQVALAIQHTKSWKPYSKPTPSTPSASNISSDATASSSSCPPRSFSPASRRHSWKTEDLKHEFHMSGVANIGECPGFTEHQHCYNRNPSVDSKETQANSSSSA